MIAVLLLAAALSQGCAGAQTAPAPGHPIALPVDDRNDTFFATPVTTSGATLLLYTDSGGGGPFLFSDSVARLGLSPSGAKPAFACRAWIPLPMDFMVAPAAMRKQNPIDGNVSDGILGGAWFDENTWTWDYPAHRLYWRAQHDVPSVAAEHVVTLGFQRSGGNHTTGFARIEAVVGGQRLSFLLDTGAHTMVTAAARHTANLPDAPFAVSFITRSIGEAWHAAHPEWPYLPGAELAIHSAMIQVPAVTVGGYTVGPAWFVERTDANFTTFMSQYMDKPIVGAIGGSVLRNFRLTVDYTAERAYFERPSGL